MEELKSELSNLLLYLSGRKTAFKDCVQRFLEYEEKRKNRKIIQNMLETRITEQTKEFLSIKDNVYT